MEALHLPDNIKVHYAACEVQNQFLGVLNQGVRYGLYTCFPFVDKKVFGKTSAPIMPLRWMENPAVDIPQYISKTMKHVIQDSGLFTLMFGSRKDIPKTKETVNKWYDGLVEYTLEHGCPVTCVEVDCQKILGVNEAWEFRERIKKDLPNNRIINVFHLEDGQKGLDRMIEFSDYIAISVPELRIANKKEYVPALAKYIKQRKPSIDIHLLGCTELGLLKKCSFCTSCDSSSWTSPKRYGFIEDYHVGDILQDKVKELVGEDVYNNIEEYNHSCVGTVCLTIEYLKRKYEIFAGNQDYYYEKNK